MKENLFDLCEWVIEKAKQSGADDSKVTIQKNRFVDIQYRDKKPENIKEATTKNLSLQLYVNQRFSSQSTSDLRKEALEQFIKNSIGNTKLLAEDPFRSLPGPEYYEGRKEADLEIIDPSYGQYSAAKRHETAKTIEEACLSEGGDKVISVESGSYDQEYEEFIMNSKGFQGTLSATEYWMGATMTAKGIGDRRPQSWHWEGFRKQSQFPDLQVIGKKAAQRTFELIGAKKIQTEKLPIIVENRIVGRILNGLISPLYGSNIQQKQSYLADRKGQPIGSPHLTIIDDPFLKGGFGSRLYDSEDGFPTKKRNLFEKGILKDYLINWYYSKKLDCEPTIGSTGNLIVPPGPRTVQEIMKDLGRGIYVNGFIGGNSNTTTGDMSIGITGTLFENGEKTQPVAEMNIADNHLEFWKKLAETANDPWKFSSAVTPSLVFEDIVVSGV